MFNIRTVCLIVFVARYVYTRGLDLQFSWTSVNFTWPANGALINTDPQDNAYDNYIYENNVPMGANKWKNKVFVTVPRRRGGIPSTLNYVLLDGLRHNPPLIPYPDWETNRRNVLGDDKVHLVSTYRSIVDECDRLWVIDDGRIEAFGPNSTKYVVQTQSIVIIDLNTDKIIRRHFFKETDLRPLTSTVNLVVDVESTNCDDAYAYVPDTLGYGLFVYSFQQNDSWRVTHRYFYLESLSGDLKVGGLKFQWMDGTFGIALSGINKDGFKTAYFHSMAGTHIFSVSTQILRSKELATRSYQGEDIKVVFDKGPDTQSTSSGLHKQTGVLFFSLVNQNALGCWNIYKRKSSSFIDIVYRDNEAFIYPSDVKVTNNEVIAVTNRFPIYTYVGLNYLDTNFRIWITNVNDAIKRTICI